MKIPEFNPTAGIPKTSYGPKSGGPTFDNATWFSTVRPPMNEARPHISDGVSLTAAEHPAGPPVSTNTDLNKDALETAWISLPFSWKTLLRSWWHQLRSMFG